MNILGLLKKFWTISFQTQGVRSMNLKGTIKHKKNNFEWILGGRSQPFIYGEVGVSISSYVVTKGTFCFCWSVQCRKLWFVNQIGFTRKKVSIETFMLYINQTCRSGEVWVWFSVYEKVENVFRHFRSIKVQTWRTKTLVMFRKNDAVRWDLDERFQPWNFEDMWVSTSTKT